MKRILGLAMVMALVALWAGCDDDGGKGSNSNNNAGVEVCNDGTDNDGDGAIDCDDSDCADDPACHLDGIERCNDGTDNDGDGKVDCDDEDCADYVWCQMDGKIGSPCRDASDCTEGSDAQCADEPGSGYPGGYCYSYCSSDSDCPEGSGCLMTLFGGYCLKTCDPNGNDCRTGYTCEDMYGDGSFYACMPACTDDSQCVITGDCAVGDEYGEDMAGYCYAPPENCSDQVDNDFDNLVDCDDTEDCAGDVACGCPEDDLGNTTPQNALALTQLPATQQAHICGPSYADWYTFTPTETKKYKVQIDFVHSQGDLDLAVYDASNLDEPIDESAGVTDQEVVKWTAEAGNTYYIEVKGYGKSSGAYTLTLDVAPAEPVVVSYTMDPTPVEPGDDATMTVTIKNEGGLPGTFQMRVVPTDATDFLTVPSTVDVGTLAPDEERSVSFPISLAEGYSLAAPIPLRLEMVETGSGETSLAGIWVSVRNAQLEMGAFSFQEDGGDSNGYVDKGETGILSFRIRNRGNAQLQGYVLVSVDGTGVTVEPSTKECATDLATGADADCSTWRVTVPSSFQGDTLALTIYATDGSREWERVWTYQLGEHGYTPVTDGFDDQGDVTKEGECDIEDLLYYVDSDGLLHLRLEFYQECPVPKLTDLYVCDADYRVCLTLTYEESNGSMVKSIYSNDGGWHKLSSVPSSYDVQVAGDTSDHVEMSIAIADLPDLDTFGCQARVMGATGGFESDGSLYYSDTYPEDGEEYFLISW